jgi:hypothetical protein
MPTQFKASERCLLSVKLERDNETDDDRTGIDELLAATEALAVLANAGRPMALPSLYPFCSIGSA